MMQLATSPENVAGNPENNIVSKDPNPMIKSAARLIILRSHFGVSLARGSSFNRDASRLTVIERLNRYNIAGMIAANMMVM